MTHCLTHHITHCLTHRITHPITKLDCMTYQDLSICTEEAKQSSYTISHTVAVIHGSVSQLWYPRSAPLSRHHKFYNTTRKRRNGGRNNHGGNMAESTAMKDISWAGMYPAYMRPKLYIEIHYCMECTNYTWKSNDMLVM